MILNLTTLFFTIAYINLYPSSNQSWELKKDQDSIKVYIRDVDDNTKEYLAETIINSDIDNIFKTITDTGATESVAKSLHEKIGEGSRLNPLS